MRPAWTPDEDDEYSDEPKGLQAEDDSLKKIADTACQREEPQRRLYDCA
jgi:hypothetical protein